MRLNLVALAFALIGLGMSTTSLQSQVLINLTNQVWRYDQSGADPGAFWDPSYDDSLWAEGRGIFAFETSTGVAALTANVYPYTNTILLQPSTGGPTRVFFRTHFNFPHAAVNNYVLVSSNLIDDGFVIYLNGQEVTRFNMSTTDDSVATGLAAAANPNNEGVYVFTNRLVIPADLLVQGDNVLAVRVHQNAGTSSDVVWGHWLHASLAYAPRIVSPTAASTITVEQGRSATLSVTVDAAPPAALQWQLDGVDIAGATASSYTITDMDDTKDGVYRVRATNAFGTSNSPPVTVVYDVDDTAPAFVHASGDPVDLTKITLYFSENMTGNISEQFNYQVESLGGGFLGVVSAASGTTSNQIVLITDPRDPGSSYQITISFHGLTDFFGNVLPDPSTRVLAFPVSFQEGVNGYIGTQDTELEAVNPDRDRSFEVVVTVDNDPVSHDLLRFDNIIGSQIPIGANIVNASLRMYTTDPTTVATPPRFHRMVTGWQETDTWNSRGAGIQTDGSEAQTAFETITLDASQDESFDTIDVTAAIQAWANGFPNNGWALIPTGGDGFRWASSEEAITDRRPMLTVDFFVPAAPCSIEQNPASVTVNEKSPFALSVSTRGSDLRYQWYRNNVAIPGATASTYTVARATAANNGTYKVIVENDIPSSCTSGNATVTVNPDTTAPALTSAVGNPDQTTISLTFNDTMDPASAGNPGNYSVPGVTVSGAAVNGNAVTLTTTPRVVGNNYTLNIAAGAVRDDAVALNPIANTSTNLFQRVRILAFDATWRYETNGTDLGSAGNPWAQPGYNDAAWATGQGLFGVETADVIANFAPYVLATPWQLTRPDGTTNVTWYLRTSIPAVNYGLSGGTTVSLRHTIDDGAVIYFNGVDSFRFNITNNPVTYTDFASATPGEGVFRTATLSNLPCGEPVVIAAEVHNVSMASSDILFGAEIIANVPSFTPCAPASRLFIVNNGDGTVTLSWTGTGTLQESTDLTNWVPSARTNGQTFTPTGLRFYRVQ